MDERPEANRPRLDSAFGRSAGRADLRAYLPAAPAAFLEGAADNPAAGEPEMILLLRNRNASPGLLLRIAKDPRWTRSHEIQKAIVRHPRTPSGIARKRLAALYWRDLIEIASDVRVPPALRHEAESSLVNRLEELTLGERVALARLATRGMIPALRGSKEGRVLRALLDNRKITERDVLGIASRADSPSEFLGSLARHPFWGGRRAVRFVLAGHPRTPVAAALRLLLELSRRDLKKLASDQRVPRIVRVGAERRLAAEASPKDEEGDD